MKIHDLESHPAADIFPMMTGGEYEELKRDIEEHGMLEPIVLSCDDTILDGRNRYKACTDLGMGDEDIAFVEWEKSNGASEVDYVISMNLKRRHLNESQRAMVGAKAKELYEADADARMKSGKKVEGGKGQSRDKAARTVNVSGRSVTNAEKILKGGSPQLVAAVEAGDIAVDSARLVSDRPVEEQDEIVSLVMADDAKNLRQAIRMHDESKRVAASKGKKKNTAIKVIAGDAFEELEKLKKGSAHLCVTDPPYGLDTHSTRRGGKDYEDGEDYIREILPMVFTELKRVLKSDGHLYVFAGYTYAYLVKEMLSEDFEVQDNPIIWVKDNHTMCDFAQNYPNKHEYIWFAKQKQGKKRKLRKCVPDVLIVPRTNVTTHSAEKPVGLLKLLIEQSSEPGEVVIDPFVGAGSTLVAAAQLNRGGIGIDHDEKWADVARSRL